MSRILLPILLFISTISLAQSPPKPSVTIKHSTGNENFSSQSQLHTTKVIWDEAENFVNGFARILKNNAFGFINTSGNLISKIEFDGARNFVNHLAAVQKEQKWGFINELGKTVIPFKYDIVYDFNDTITAVYEGKKWSLINQNGTIFKSLDIAAFFGFDNEKAKIVKDGKVKYMNSTGEISAANETVPALRQRPFIPPSNAASDCPDNIDFENGSFVNWKCFTGNVDSAGPSNVITVTPSAAIPNRHTIISRSSPSNIDPYGLFPTNPPDGSNFAVKLGNTMIGAEAERIQYRIQIPQNDSNFSIKYDYAVVFEDPGHTAWTQPRFLARLFDSAANAYINCASFEYISTSSLPGFASSGVDSTVIYKPWSTVYINLRNHAGKTLFLEFTTADCVRRGHWGYAYVDIESTCGQSVNLQYDCTFPGIADLTAPPGFQTYNWWNEDYTILLGTGEQVTLNPGPRVNSHIYLELIPFSEFGCRDTMAVKITGTFTPRFDASESAANCAPHQFTFYNRNLPSASVTWNFGDGNTATGDTVSHTYLMAGSYMVTMNVTLPSGCDASAQEMVRISQSSGSFSYTGGNFCNSHEVAFIANGNNISNITWDFGDGSTVSGSQTNITHIYSLPGVYVPHLIISFAGGCETDLYGTDTIRIEKLSAGFSDSLQSGCGSAAINFTDTSFSFFGISSREWSFGDGANGSGPSVSHNYTATGNYNVQLIITGINGCKDTIVKPVFVTVNNVPQATVTGPATGCPLSMITFNGQVQSSDPVNSLLWTSTNGDTGSGNTFTVNFPLSGNYSIQLITATVSGCTDTVVHQINIDSIPILDQPRDQELCNGSSSAEIIFSSSVSNATYSWTNNEPSIGLAAAGSGNLPSFTAINNTGSAITATISVIASNDGCMGIPKTFLITVNATPTIAQPADQTVCNRTVTTSVNLTSFTNAAAAASYSWTNDLPSIGLSANGSGNIPAFTAINNAAFPVTATITIIPLNNGCTGLPVIFTITVNPTPTINPPADRAICNGSLSTPIYFTGNVNGTGFSWTNDLPGIGLANNGLDSIGSFAAINFTQNPLIANIAVQPVFNGCTGITAFFTITVNPTPVINQPSNQSLCSGSSTASVQFTSTTTGVLYSWTNSLPLIGLAASGTGNIPSFNPNNNTSAAITATIAVTPMANSCRGLPKNFTVTILPSPTVIQPFNLFLCNGETTPVMPFMSSVNGANFTWTNSLTSIGLAAGGTGSIPSFTAVNNTNTTLVAALTVRASTSTCTGLPKTFYITVDPTPEVSDVADKAVCEGATVERIIFSGSVNNTNFTWINNNTAIGLEANGIGDIPAFTAVNNTNSPITAIISVTGTANSCGSIVRVFTITVNPSPGVDVPSDVSVCNGSSISAIAITGPVNGTNFSWTNSNASIGLASNGAGDIVPFTAINNTGTPLTATINIVGTGNNCGSTGTTFTITVHPTPAVTANNNMDVCLGNSAQLMATGASGYSWSPSTGLSCADCPNPLVTPTDSILYSVSGVSSFGCTASDSVMLRVRKPFDMLIPPGDTICSGESMDLRAINANAYLWSPAVGLNRTDVANPRASPVTTTRYRVVGYDGYNCFTDTGYVTIAVGPNPAVNIGPDIQAATGSVITLKAITENGPITSWQWSPSAGLSCNDCPAPTTTILNGGTYTLTVQNAYGCLATDVITVNGFCQKAQVFIPNAFTPDGDGLNDMLMVRGSGIRVKSFRIFSRWGELIFEKLNFSANDVKYGWDGKIRGIPSKPDVFVYTAEVICDNNVVYTLKGNTTILK